MLQYFQLALSTQINYYFIPYKILLNKIISIKFQLRMLDLFYLFYLVTIMNSNFLWKI
jgi:hypothetical protein